MSEDIITSSVPVVNEAQDWMRSSTSPTPSTESSSGSSSCIRTFYDNVDSEVESHFARALQRHSAGTYRMNEDDGSSATTVMRSSPLSGILDQSEPEESCSLKGHPSKDLLFSPLSLSSSSMVAKESQIFTYPPTSALEPTSTPNLPLSSPCTANYLKAKPQQPQFINQLQVPNCEDIPFLDLPTVPGESPDFCVPVAATIGTKMGVGKTAVNSEAGYNSIVGTLSFPTLTQKRYDFLNTYSPPMSTSTTDCYGLRSTCTIHHATDHYSQHQQPYQARTSVPHHIIDSTGNGNNRPREVTWQSRDQFTDYHSNFLNVY